MTSYFYLYEEGSYGVSHDVEEKASPNDGVKIEGNYGKISTGEVLELTCDVPA